MTQRTRILIVGDSALVCRTLSGAVRADAALEVVGQAHTARKALELVGTLRPAAIALALTGPGWVGVLETVMFDQPTPVVGIAPGLRADAEEVRQALHLGAVAVVAGGQRPPEAIEREVQSKLRMAAQVKVIRSLRSHGNEPPASTRRDPVVPLENPPAMRVIVIGASTGGPVAVREVLAQWPVTFPAAVIVVQHLPQSFTPVLAGQLARHVPLPVTEARNDDRLQNGQVLVAPGDTHLLIRPGGRIQLDRRSETTGHRPSIDLAMESAAEVFGAATRGVVLSGMGQDGTRGLGAIRRRGGKTYAQNSASCAVNGMPQAALDSGVVDRVETPTRIAQLLFAEFGNE